MVRFLCCGMIAALLSSTADAEPPVLAPAFADSMVLQQGVRVPVWGTAAVGDSVAVTFAHQRKTTTADGHGRWSVALDAMQADATPRKLTVTAGSDSLVLRDVLVGEVWIAAGQSNMEWPLASDAHAKDELPQADHSQLRLFNLNYAGQNYFAKPFDSDILGRLTPERFYEGTWQRCSPQSAERVSAVGYYFGKELHQTLNVPVGVIHLAVGGSPTEAWIRRQAMAECEELAPLIQGDWLVNENLGSWCRERGRENLALAANTQPPGDELGFNHPYKPGFLWDSGIARLIPLPIRGVIWYQGESNSLELRRVRQHERLLPLLVADWRKQWGVGQFSFLYCQLSSIGTERGYPSQHWPEFRDSQRRLLATIPKTGMAVTSDVGHRNDVHPRNKKDVGHRLALWALAQTYSRKTAYSGPLPKSIQRDGAELVVVFDHADEGLATSDSRPACGFEIAGAGGVFWPAVAVIGQSTVTLSSQHVVEPLTVRYGWQPFSIGNLTNGAGLPASTFFLTLPRE